MMPAQSEIRTPIHPVRIIATEVARMRGIAFGDLISQHRAKSIVGPRHETMWLARHLTPCSLPAIGRKLGGRDHTTVMHGIRKVDERIADEVGYGDELETMQTVIRPKLPDRTGWVSVPPSDVDAVEVARRVRKAFDDKTSIQLFADEIGALALRVIADGLRIEALAAELKARPLQIDLTKPDREPAPSAPSIRTVLPSRLPAVLDAFRQFERERYGLRERFAAEHLYASLTALRASLTPTISKD